MTYAEFLLLFLILPFIVLAIFLRRRFLDRRYLVLTGLLMLIALLYMAPWDHIAVNWGLWTWANGQTWGLRLWAIPPEEYLFCIFEALLAITLTYALLSRKMGNDEASAVLSRQRFESTAQESRHDGKRSIAARMSQGDHLEGRIEDSNREERP